MFLYGTFKTTTDELTKTKRELGNAKDQLDATSHQMANLMILFHAQLQSSKNSSAIDIVSGAKPSVKLNAMEAMFKFSYYTCPVVLKMSEYSQKKNNDEHWHSDVFYTHHQGYSMRLSVVPAGLGTGKGTHLSLYLYLMQGPHDDKLNWPLRERFQIQLINQINSSVNYSVITTYSACDNNDRRCKEIFQFILNKELHKTTATQQFIKDNSVFFQVTKL